MPSRESWEGEQRERGRGPSLKALQCPEHVPPHPPAPSLEGLSLIASEQYRCS